MSTIIRQRQSHEPRTILNGEPRIFAEGRIGAIVQFPVLVDEGNGYVEKMFEKFVRPPGTRIIAVHDSKIYLQQEVRLEKQNIPDWRLPGGKVVDSFKEYQQFLTKPVPQEVIIAAAKKELHEEAGLEATVFTVFTKKDCGATVEWDLYYVIAEDVMVTSQRSDHNEGEDIKGSHWFTFEEILDKCRRGEISEGRTVAVLLEYISSLEK